MYIDVQGQNINVSCAIKTLEFGYSCEWFLVVRQVVDQNFNRVENSHLGIWEVQFNPAVCIWVSILWRPDPVCNFCDLTLKRSSPSASHDPTANNLVSWCRMCSCKGRQNTDSLCWVRLCGVEWTEIATYVNSIAWLLQCCVNIVHCNWIRNTSREGCWNTLRRINRGYCNCVCQSNSCWVRN